MIPVNREFARSVLEGMNALRSHADQIDRDVSSDTTLKPGGSVVRACLEGAERARMHADVLEGWLYRHARDLGMQSELPARPPHGGGGE